MSSKVKNEKSPIEHMGACLTDLELDLQFLKQMKADDTVKLDVMLHNGHHMFEGNGKFNIEEDHILYGAMIAYTESRISRLRMTMIDYLKLQDVRHA